MNTQGQVVYFKFSKCGTWLLVNELDENMEINILLRTDATGSSDCSRNSESLMWQNTSEKVIFVRLLNWSTLVNDNFANSVK